MWPSKGKVIPFPTPVPPERALMDKLREQGFEFVPYCGEVS